MSGIQDLTFSFSSTSIMHTISSLMNGWIYKKCL
jgi:hypothetical protein